MQWDVFITHAREDDAAVARPLAEALRRHGLTVLLDGQALAPGDSVRGRVDDGLARGRWGVLVVSRHFLDGAWPRGELDGLLARPLSGERLILPVWHGVTAAEVARRAPLLAARLAIGTGRGLDAVCASILAAIGNDAIRVTEPRRTTLIPLWLSLLEDPGFSLAQVRRHLALRESYAGQSIGVWTLRELVGVGGSGAVFHAVHGVLGRQAALKLFFPFVDDPRLVARTTERVVRGLSSLRHPGLVSLLDYGYLRISIGAAPYLVYEHVDGAPLPDWSRAVESTSADRHALLARRLEVAVRAAEALHHAHGSGFTDGDGARVAAVTHGDLKPSNLLVRRNDDQPVLLDFMMPLVQRMAAERLISWNSWEKDTEGRYQEIPADHPFGAPGYVPPEQEIDRIVTPASDVYALGRTFEDLFWPGAPGSRRRPRDPADPCAATEAEIERLVEAMTASQPGDRPALDGEVLPRLRAIRTVHQAVAGASAPA